MTVDFGEADDPLHLSMRRVKDEREYGDGVWEDDALEDEIEYGSATDDIIQHEYDHSEVRD